eukprot:TRINITY_DN7157_c0_g1_i2.p1 TRINITY_DN7157_c0_g1~~TRINITY_DN7157_c0_g1_i2.p1  ORF type:complete len:542 (+),score=136.64 TRINITY_DN7157_c0_g1_i2:139-1764(+)
MATDASVAPDAPAEVVEEVEEEEVIEIEEEEEEEPREVDEVVDPAEPDETAARPAATAALASRGAPASPSAAATAAPPSPASETAAFGALVAASASAAETEGGGAIVTGSSASASSKAPPPLAPRYDIPHTTRAKKMRYDMALMEMEGELPRALVPVELSETHGEDGRLLRMFVRRGLHLKEDAIEAATKRWLIREHFFEEQIEEYIKQYGPKPGGEVSEELSAEAGDILALFQQALGPSMRRTDALESQAEFKDADPISLRDTLMEAIQALTTPRRLLGNIGHDKMRPERKEQLKAKEQTRLRKVVYVCLHRMWKAGVGAEVLKIALEKVREKILKFEAKFKSEEDAADLNEAAMAGGQWSNLQELAAQIDDHIRAEEGEEGAREARPGFRTASKKEGSGTRSIVEKAVTELGGKATCLQIRQWIEENKSVLEQVSKTAKLNEAASRSAKAKNIPTWHLTVTSAVVERCEACGKADDKRTLYRLKLLKRGYCIQAHSDGSWEPTTNRELLRAEKQEEGAHWLRGHCGWTGCCGSRFGRCF